MLQKGQVRALPPTSSTVVPGVVPGVVNIGREDIPEYVLLD
jgi:hypothetical protein